MDEAYSKLSTVGLQGELKLDAEQIAPSERKRFGRIGGMLLIIGSLAAAPAAAFLEPAPDPIEYLIILAGVVLGMGLMATPWERLPERALAIVSIVATGYVVMGASEYSDDFAIYQVLIAVFTAYVVRDRRDFLALMAFFTIATVAPVFLAGESFNEAAHHILVILPVMIISAAVVRFLRDALAEREDQYRRFAVEAVTLAERIRGGPAKSRGTTTEDVEQRIADLASEARR